MEDIMIGRRSRYIQRSVALAITSGQLLFRSPYRITLILGPTSGPNVWVSPDSPAVVGQGFLLNGQSLPQTYDVRLHGSMVPSDWFAIAEVGTPTLFLVEIVLPEGEI